MLTWSITLNALLLVLCVWQAMVLSRYRNQDKDV